MTISFAEVVLDTGFIVYRTHGGSGYSTNVVTVNSGVESRNKNWENSRGKWEYGDRKVLGKELHSLEHFFRLRNGRFQGFRFRDWGNYQVTAEALTEYNTVSQGVIVPLTDSTIQGQLYKKVWDTETSLSDTVEFRKIVKPRITVIPQVFKNDVELTYVADWNIDLSTGIFTFAVAFDPDNDVLTCTTEFDTPVRFDSDQFDATFIAGNPVLGVPNRMDEVAFLLQSLPIVELRVL